MKKDRKPLTPPIAAQSTDQKNHKTAPPPATHETKARVSRAAKGKCIESLVLDRISDGVVAFDRAMTPIYVNERAGQLLGREPADLIGKNLWAEYPDSMQTPFAQACQSALETQTVTAFDGSFLPVQDSWLEGRIYPSQDGLSVIFTGAAQSQQGRIERRRRREDRYQILFDEMQEGFALAQVILDENGKPRDYRVLEANAAMTRFLGKSREELVGHTVQEVFAFDEQDSEILQRAGRVALGGEPFFIEDYSEILNRSFRIHIFSPGHGQFACLFSDITQTKRTGTALRKSEEKFSRAFHLSPSAMGIMRTSDAKFLDINESLLNMFGLTREQVIGRGVRDLGIIISEEDRQSITSTLQEKGHIRDHELTTQGPSGTVHHMLLSVEVIEIEDVPCVLVAAVDITERKRAEEKILDISKFPGQNPNPIMRFTRQGELLYANQSAAPLLTFWGQQHGQIPPPELQELLSSATALQANVEIEIEGAGRIFSCLLVAIQDTDYVNFYFRDVTERRQAAMERARTEEQLRQSEQLFATVFRSSPTAIVLTRLGDLKITDVNEVFCSLFGYSREETLGHSSVELGLMDAESHHKAIEQLKQEGLLRNYEQKARDRNGRQLDVLLSIEMLRVKGEMYMLTSIIDITERKRVEQALKAEQELLARIFESIPVMLTLYDPSVTILKVNSQFEKSLGWRSEELAHISIMEESYPDPDKRRQVQEFMDACEDGKWMDFQMRTRAGGTLETSWSNIRLSNDVQVGIGLDISERKQAENQIRQLNAELQSRIDEMDSLMEILPVGVWVGNEDCSVITGNAAAYSLIGLKRGGNASLSGPESDRPAGLQVVIDGQDVPPEDAPMQRVARSGKPLLDFEHELRFPDGERKSIFTSIAPLLDEQGRVRKVIGAYTDITERKRMEETLQAARGKAEQTAHRIAQLQKVTAALSEALTSSQVAQIVTEQGAPAFGALSSSMMLLSEDGQALEIMYSTSPQGIINPYARFPISLDVPAADVMRSGQPVWIESRQQYLERYPHLADQIERWGHEAAIAIPMEYEDHVLGVLTMSFDRVLTNTREDQEYALTLARQAAQALERARAEEALRESEARLRAIISQATAGMVRKDPSGKLLFVNQAFCEMLGFGESELLGKTMWQLTHEEDIEENKRLYNRLMVEGTQFQLEKRLIRRDGSTLWVTVSVSPVLDAAGKTQSAVSVYADITERKHAEQQLHHLNIELEDRVQKRTAELRSAYEFLQESEATSRLILEAMPDAIVITNRDGLIVHCNARVETLFGYSPPEVLGQPVEILLPARYHEKHVKHRVAYEEQKYRRIMGLDRDLFGRRKDGSEFAVEVLLSPIHDYTTWDVMMSIRDNTQQKQAQQALRTSEEKLRTLFEILPVGISFLDRDARITDTNSALADILGVPKEQLLKETFKSRSYIRPDGTPMPPTEFASTRALTENKTIYNVETGIVKDNEEITWTNVNAAPVQVADVEAVVVTVDITERKQAEAALHKSRERLRVLSRRLVEVQEDERRALARELHDRVGQNLAALNLNLNILRNQFSDDFLKHLGPRLDDSVNLVRQIITITRNVMDDLRSNVLDDYGLEAALSEYTEKFTQRYGIPVVTDKPAHPIPRMNSGIEMTLLRIAQEALMNVSRHAQATQVSLSLNVDEDAVYMAIKDNGSGILSWQKANQAGSHGLRIIRERAEAFGGLLQVNSAYKKGTQIEVRIPLGSGS
ncbi:MAG: PAS domain S-box protein [Chloroflexota bacterium]